MSIIAMRKSYNAFVDAQRRLAPLVMLVARQTITMTEALVPVSVENMPWNEDSEEEDIGEWMSECRERVGHQLGLEDRFMMTGLIGTAVGHSNFASCMYMLERQTPAYNKKVAVGREPAMDAWDESEIALIDQVLEARLSSVRTPIVIGFQIADRLLRSGKHMTPLRDAERLLVARPLDGKAALCRSRLYNLIDRDEADAFLEAIEAIRDHCASALDLPRPPLDPVIEAKHASDTHPVSSVSCPGM